MRSLEKNQFWHSEVLGGSLCTPTPCHQNLKFPICVFLNQWLPWYSPVRPHLFEHSRWLVGWANQLLPYNYGMRIVRWRCTERSYAINKKMQMRYGLYKKRRDTNVCFPLISTSLFSTFSAPQRRGSECSKNRGHWNRLRIVLLSISAMYFFVQTVKPLCVDEPQVHFVRLNHFVRMNESPKSKKRSVMNRLTQHDQSN